MARGEARAFYEQSFDHPREPCLPWPYRRDGRGYPTLWDEGVQRSLHVITCKRVHGPKPSPKHEAAHSCGRGMHGCANPHHVAGWKTRVENEADKKAHGTHKGRTITWEIVEALREAGRYLPIDFLAISVGLTRCSVDRILRHKSWRLDRRGGSETL